MTEVKDVGKSVNEQFSTILKDSSFDENQVEKLTSLLAADKTPKAASILQFFKQCNSEGESV